MQGNPAWHRDVQTVHLPLPHHYLLYFSCELPQEVGLLETISLFLVIVLLSFMKLVNVVVFLGRILQEKYPASLLSRLLGKQQFLLAFNVLDLVYLQSVFWVGVYYCPLLPLIGVVTLIFKFYIQKV